MTTTTTTLPPRPAVTSAPSAIVAPQPDRLQRHALHELHQHLGGGGRGVLVMPCGAGKTLVGRLFAQQIAARVTVVFVPTLALVPQTVIAYRAGAAWEHHTMIVCSDPASGRTVGLGDLDLPMWARVSVTASTSARVIGQFLTGSGPARVIVSTYHSAPRVVAALQQAGVVADLAVCDEAHNLAGRPRREFRAVLDDTLPVRRRVFLTATPVEAAAWSYAVDPDTVEQPLSLDDESLFGPTVYRAQFADAIAVGRLVDYDVEVLATRADTDTSAPGAAPGAVPAVLASVRDGATRILTFHTRISGARQLAEHLDGHRLPDGRTVHAEHLEARHRAQHRTAVLDRLAHPHPSEVTVVSSARTLTEGIDVPAVDTVVFAEPRTSPVEIVQAVGRVMRRAPGKDRGRVVLAVTVADTNLDADTELAATVWRPVWTVLRALATMDPRFATRLRTRSQPQGGTRARKAGPGLRLNLPAELDTDLWMLRALDRTGGGWWRRYDLLKDYAREHRHARPGQGPQSVRDGVALGAWVAHQRTLHSQGILEPDRVAALEQLPGWAWSARDTAWWRAAEVWERTPPGTWHPDSRTAWALLLDTPCWRSADGQKPALSYDHLAGFVVETCARRRRGELAPHLERAATGLPGWRWNVVDAQDARMVDALAEYGEWSKDLNPPHDYRTDDGLPLGSWVTAIRRRYYTGRLHPALELELAAIARHDWTPLRWDKGDTGWRLGYLALRHYAARQGTTRMPQDHVEALPDHDLNLSRWCTVQRFARRRGQLAPERVAALEQIPGWQWDLDLRAGDRPVLDHVVHGDRTSGYCKGCRCDPCTDANARYRATLAVEGAVLLDAGPARGHLRMLLARGVSVRAVARAADLNRKTITDLEDGTLDRCRPETIAAVLRLTFDQALEAALPGDRIPAGPTWHLLNPIISRGWPKAWIAREIGCGTASLQLREDFVTVRNARAAAAFAERIGERLPPKCRDRARTLPTLSDLLQAS